MRRIEQTPQELPTPEPDPVTPDRAVEILDSIKERAFDDNELMDRFRALESAADTYVETKRNDIIYGSVIAGRRELGGEDKIQPGILSPRTEAHKTLIEAFKKYVERAQQLGHETTWWDGPNGLKVDPDPEAYTSRKRIDNWASFVWLAKKEAEEKRSQQSPEKKRESGTDRPRRRPAGRRRPAQPSAA